MFQFTKFVLLFVLLSPTIGQAKKIVLPPIPGPENSKTLLGVDKNKNGVRDEIEHFIYKEISKEYDVYMAYLMRAQSLQNILVFYPNVEKVKNNELQERTDGECLRVVEKDKDHLIQKSAWIVDQTFDTPERKRVDRWLVENQFKITAPYVLPNHIDRNKVCRF